MVVTGKTQNFRGIADNWIMRTIYRMGTFLKLADRNLKLSRKG
jgi:hypothetical protein